MAFVLFAGIRQKDVICILGAGIIRNGANEDGRSERVTALIKIGDSMDIKKASLTDLKYVLSLAKKES